MCAASATFPNVGVRLDFFDRILNDERMKTPMRMLPIVIVDASNKKSVRKAPDRLDTLESCRTWGRRYRVFSHLAGDEEFQRYDGKIPVGLEKWKKALNRPPMTTTQVNICIVKVDTFEAKTSYCEMLRSRGETHMIGVPTCFLSHAWQYYFKNLVEAVKDHFSEHPRHNVYIWNDIFSEEQNDAISKDKDYFYNAFKDAIESIGYTLLVLDPWDKPIPLSRSWCIWEVYSTIETGAKLQIAMPRHSKNEFRKVLLHDLQTIAKRMSAINAQKAQAFFAETKKRIDQVIESTCGFIQVNKVISQKLRLWLARMGWRVLSEEEKLRGKEMSSNLVMNLALLFNTLGDLDSTEKLLKRALRVREDVFGAYSIETLVVVEHLGTVMYQEGRLNESHELLSRVMEICLKKFGPDHSITLMSKQNFARLVRYEGDLDKAEMLMREVLTARRKILGAKHVETLETANSLARVLRYQGKQKEAASILRDTIKLRKTVLGSRHHDTVASYNNLAGCLREMKGESLEAEKMFKHVIRILIETLGETHRNTINARGNLGLVYLKRDDVSDIEKGRQMVVRSLNQLLSPPHNFSEKQSWVRKFRKALMKDDSGSPVLPTLSSCESTASRKLQRLNINDGDHSSSKSKIRTAMCTKENEKLCGQ